MDLIDQLRQLASRIANTKSLIQTEEATKNAMVMPFIQLLGYNVFDPTEVTPELVADVGTKKGEKVDYAILSDGRPIMLQRSDQCAPAVRPRGRSLVAVPLLNKFSDEPLGAAWPLLFFVAGPALQCA